MIFIPFFLFLLIVHFETSLSIEFNIYINPFKNSSEEIIFSNLDLGFKFLKTQMDIHIKEQIQANFWLLNGMFYNLPQIYSPINFTTFNDSGISFNSFSRNKTMEQNATIVLNKSFSFMHFCQMNLSFNNLNILALNPFSLERSPLIFNKTSLYFNWVIIKADLS